jgi:hypothetical protein
MLHKIKVTKVNWIGHMLLRNCLLKHIVEGKIKEGIYVMGRIGRRYKQLLDDCKEKRGHLKLEGKTLNCTV